MVDDDNNNNNNNNIYSSNHLNQPSIVPALSTSSNNPPTFPILTRGGNNARHQLREKQMTPIIMEITRAKILEII